MLSMSFVEDTKSHLSMTFLGAAVTISGRGLVVLVGIEVRTSSIVRVTILIGAAAGTSGV